MIFLSGVADLPLGLWRWAGVGFAWEQNAKRFEARILVTRCLPL
jgi:hypothetical protein